MENEKQIKTGHVKMITPPTGRSMSSQFLSKSWLTSLNRLLSFFVAVHDTLWNISG